ncbi:hypothetical protein ACYZTX_19110 [Pseudomonas sp. MDT1-17]
MDEKKVVGLLVELQEIYRKEGERNYDHGFSAALAALCDQGLPELERWSEARSIYRTMAGGKSGFSDFYIDKNTVEERILENKRLDEIRQQLWLLFE